MKKIIICVTVVILLFTGCNSGKECSNKNAKCIEDWSNEDVKEIIVYMIDPKGNKGTTAVVQDRKKIDFILNTMQTAEPMPGDLKVIPPDYEAEIVLKDKNITPSSIQLWLPSESEGMIVFSDSSSQGYKVTKEQNKGIKEIIESVRIYPAK
ncbi:hypothetical protein [Paenibacillus contaminans]|uniref:YhfM-like domain-containing protein n=1 Tax=Paenibacillus contaminans TaxID=450362 RepID=A0A329MCZ3_9BACL|nr:hypothetical protein [Paenibacillus contaminans]RAV14897.1 hypothetical protein DQG23_31190 [Paenibacillus contaminans]